MSGGRIYRPRLVFWLVVGFALVLACGPAVWEWFNR